MLVASKAKWRRSNAANRCLYGCTLIWFDGMVSTVAKFCSGDADIVVYKTGANQFLRTAMLTRRLLILTGLIAALTSSEQHLASAQSASPSDPAGIITAIYTRVTKGKGDGGGGFVIENKAAKAKYLSKSLIALWAKADAHTPKGEVGPIEFDPVTNSQDPDVKSFTQTTEKLDADHATIVVTMTGHRNDRKPSDQVVHYDFVREGEQWKIDEIKGSIDGEPWSVRGMLSDSLKG